MCPARPHRSDSEASSGSRSKHHTRCTLEPLPPHREPVEGACGSMRAWRVSSWCSGGVSSALTMYADIRGVGGRSRSDERPLLCRLYNKDAILEHRLNKLSGVEISAERDAKVKHIRGLKDVVELKLTKTPGFDPLKGSDPADTAAAQFCCPVLSDVEMNGRHSCVLDPCRSLPI